MSQSAEMLLTAVQKVGLRRCARLPSGVTRLARSLSDTETRLDRFETALNEALPGDARDTTTPGACCWICASWSSVIAFCANARATDELADLQHDRRNPAARRSVAGWFHRGWLIGA
jgi:hypothetical protein